MPKLNWNGDDFRDSQDSSGTVADNISRSGNLQQGYNHGSLTRGLVAYYPMEKGDGSFIPDGALNYPGRLDGVSWSSDPATGNYSLDFGKSGSTDSMVTKLVSSELGPITTFSFWLKPLGSNERSLTISGYKSDPNRWFIEWDYNSNSKIWWQEWESGTNISSQETIPADQWKHVTVIHRKQQNVKIYVDGQKSGEGSISHALNVEEIIRIGGNPNHGFDDAFPGLIDDVRIYDRALSQPEI